MKNPSHTFAAPVLPYAQVRMRRRRPLENIALPRAPLPVKNVYNKPHLKTNQG
jgi:hypothetical protein